MIHALSYRLTLSIVVAIALVVVACGDNESAVEDSTGEQFGGETEEIAEIVADLNAYWSEADEELGFDYQPVPLDRLTTGADGVTCDGKEIEPAETEDNAFVDSGCSEGILIAYDPAYVASSLATAEATMAHEWGHVIQAQAEEIDLSQDSDGLPIDAELQADCLAGAWASERALETVERLRQDVAKTGDESDVDIEDPHAHGTPEQRTTAFDVGLDGGPSACVDELIDALPE